LRHIGPRCFGGAGMISTMAKKPTKPTKPVIIKAAESPEERVLRCKRLIDEAVASTRCRLASGVEITEGQVTSKIQIIALD
jgi:hypothetical protein